MRTRTTLMTLAALGSLLGACHKEPERPPENQTVEAPAPVEPTPTPEPDATPAPVTAPAAETPKIAAAPKPSADEQMLDDAEATGMTSHASHDADTSDAAGNSQP